MGSKGILLIFYHYSFDHFLTARIQLQTVIELAAYPCQQIARAVNVIKNNSQAAEANFRL